MKLTLHVWRQKNAEDRGRMVRYEVPGVNEHMSFLEMLDMLNERLTEKGEDPIAFDHDCREGICGMCGMMINGTPRLSCAAFLREYYPHPVRVEPLANFPVERDLVIVASRHHGLPVAYAPL